MHDHGGPDLITVFLGLAATVAHALQSAVAPLLLLCTVGGFTFSALRFAADWPELRAKFLRNRADRLARRVQARAAELERDGR